MTRIEAGSDSDRDFPVAELASAAKTSAAIHMPIEVRPFFDATANN